MITSDGSCHTCDRFPLLVTGTAEHDASNLFPHREKKLEATYLTPGIEGVVRNLRATPLLLWVVTWKSAISVNSPVTFSFGFWEGGTFLTTYLCLLRKFMRDCNKSVYATLCLYHKGAFCFWLTADDGHQLGHGWHQPQPVTYIPSTPVLSFIRPSEVFWPAGKRRKGYIEGNRLRGWP